MADFMCAYGNCESEDTPILVNDKDRGERNRFCCQKHAGLWLLKQSWLLSRHEDRGDIARESLVNSVARELAR